MFIEDNLPTFLIDRCQNGAYYDCYGSGEING